jgi:hypothetical protein
MKSKSEAPDHFRDDRAEVEKQLDRSINRIRVDGGGEYSSREFLSYLAENGIIKETTAPLQRPAKWRVRALRQDSSRSGEVKKFDDRATKTVLMVTVRRGVTTSFLTLRGRES